MKKRILIIDDSALMRRVLSDILEESEEFTTYKTANNGEVGLNIVREYMDEIDGIILDINMPKMDGIEFLTILNKEKIYIPVLLVSSIAKSGAEDTIRALELGAYDFITKPTSIIEIRDYSFGKRLIHFLTLMTTVHEIRKEETRKPFVPPKTETTRKTGNKLVVISSSTGGPKALHQIIPSIPKDFDSPVLIVQHMPEGFTKSLAIRLNERSEITVTEAEDGLVLQKGVIYIAKGGYQTTVQRQAGEHILKVGVSESKNLLNPCADFTLRSLDDSKFDEIICVVLTGMGRDSLEGIKELKKKKTVYVITEDKSTCVVYGMPKAICSAGLEDEVQRVENIADAMIRNVGVHKNGCKPIS